MIGAVVFDLDGVILQTEELWDEVRGHYVVDRGGRYDETAQRAIGKAIEAIRPRKAGRSESRAAP